MMMHPEPARPPEALNDPLCSESWDEAGFVLTITRKPGFASVLWLCTGGIALYDLYELVVVQRGRIFDISNLGFVLVFVILAFVTATLPKRASRVIISVSAAEVAVRYEPRGVFERNLCVPLSGVTRFALRERGAGYGSRWPILCTLKGDKAIGVTAGSIGSVRLPALIERLNYVLARVLNLARVSAVVVRDA